LKTNTRSFLRGLAVPELSAARPDEGLAPANGRRSLRVYFIKPSKYDTDGTLLQYRWGVIPSNTLIVLGGLNAAYAAGRPDIALQTVLWDEVVDRPLSGEVIRSIGRRGRDDGVDVVIGIAGIQSNQYPRARDIALQFKAQGLSVILGGFHISSHQPSRDFLMSVGTTVVIGEAETIWARILDDYLDSGLRPLYQLADGIRAKTGNGEITVPHIETAPLPAVDARYARRFFNPTFSTIDTSRGCPFVCSYCSVKNVMGRSMRARDPEQVVAWLRDAHDHHGITNFLVVDDDFYRSPSWEPILRGMARLRDGGRAVFCILQTDIESSAYADTPGLRREAAKHARSRRFVELAAAAGCFEVFMGFESFSPANLEAASKFHNEDLIDRGHGPEATPEARDRVKARYRRAVESWHNVGVGVHCGYIIGMPFDEPGCGAQAARDLSEIGVDIASFFAYTPLPGTEDFDAAESAGAIFDCDFNNYDSAQFVSTHPRLSPAQLQCEYRDAYRTFYSWRRLAWSLSTLHRVALLSPAARYGMLAQQIYYTYSERRGRHPMLGGIWRIRDQHTRRRVVTDEEAVRAYLAV
jgi:radical SAM superfamily enzyme YgiQ (UPF0313 family)